MKKPGIFTLIFTTLLLSACGSNPVTQPLPETEGPDFQPITQQPYDEKYLVPHGPVDSVINQALQEQITLAMETMSYLDKGFPMPPNAAGCNNHNTTGDLSDSDQDKLPALLVFYRRCNVISDVEQGTNMFWQVKDLNDQNPAGGFSIVSRGQVDYHDPATYSLQSSKKIRAEKSTSGYQVYFENDVQRVNKASEYTYFEKTQAYNTLSYTSSGYQMTINAQASEYSTSNMVITGLLKITGTLHFTTACGLSSGTITFTTGKHSVTKSFKDCTPF